MIDEWIVSAKKACEWFVELIGEDEWIKRRRKVVDYFKATEDNVYSQEQIQKLNINKLFTPVAVYDDWMSWYMYLIESLITRPTSGDAVQAARISPFFSTIGRNIHLLKNIKGVENRVRTLLNTKQNKPDSTLFELVVALCYCKNGWAVSFIEEMSTMKTPDLLVERDGIKYFVECKRLAKINEFSEAERIAWQKRWKHLALVMRLIKIPAFVDITFKVPVESVNEDILAKVFLKSMNDGLKTGNKVSNNELDMTVKRLDLVKINRYLSNKSVKNNSPELIEALCGNYDYHGSYTLAVAPSELYLYGENDELQVLNKFIGKVSEAYAAKWECSAQTSVHAKAKDVKKALSKAIEQIPEGETGIIHIGYETVNGPNVEIEREKKIRETIYNFDVHSKNISSIFCHAIQPLTTVAGWECAETTMFFGSEAKYILGDSLLLGPPETKIRDATHWAEDILNQKSKNKKPHST